MYLLSMPNVFPSIWVVQLGRRSPGCDGELSTESMCAWTIWLAALSTSSTCDRVIPSTISRGGAGSGRTQSFHSPGEGPIRTIPCPRLGAGVVTLSAGWGGATAGVSGAGASGGLATSGVGAGLGFSRGVIPASRPFSAAPPGSWNCMSTARSPSAPGGTRITIEGGSREGGSHGVTRTRKTSAWTATLMAIAHRWNFRRRCGSNLGSGPNARSPDALERPSDACHRFLQPVGVDRQRDAEIALPRRAEGAAGKGHHAGSLQHPAGERRRRDPRGERHPQVHRRLGARDVEPGGTEGRHAGVATLGQDPADRTDQRLRAVQCHDPRLLEREKRPGVYVRLDPGERTDQLGPSSRPAQKAG